MQDIVNSALENAEKESRDVDSSDGAEFGDPRIVIIGAGGAGNNTVNRLYNIGVDGADTVAINTDKQHLKMVEADTKILVGKSLTQGLGAGGDPSMGERATEMAQGTIKEVLGDADLVFVTAGMGGGTGTGAAPICAKIAKEQGAIVVGMVSTPFNVERARTVKAEEGLEKLRNEADSIIVLDNNRLLDYVPNLPIGKAFSVMDQIIAETVKGISETITQPSLINLDYADMTSIMNQGGVAVMLVGETQDKNKTEEVVKDAMNHPLLDVDYRGASGGLVHITGGPDLTLKEAEGIAQNITERLEASANVIWGARIQEEYKGKVRVMAIMTGVQSAQILGPTTQKQADASRAAIEGEVPGSGSGSESSSSGSFSGNGGGNTNYGETDGGRSEVEQNNGLDVIR
jgi:cell division protein FtsZ